MNKLAILLALLAILWLWYASAYADTSSFNDEQRFGTGQNVNLTSTFLSKPDKLKQTSRAMTDTLIFTTTEHFTTYTYQDPNQTTADWNIRDGVLQLPRLANASAQASPAMAVDTAGHTYVVWQDYRNTDGYYALDIYAQKFDPDGYRLWPADVRVNSGSSLDAENQFYLSDNLVTVLDSDGNLVVVWEDGATNAPRRIYAQKLDPNGYKVWRSNEDTPENRRVDHDTYSDRPENPAVALDPTNGDIVVVWQDRRNGNWDIYAQRLKTDGFPRREGNWINDLRVDTDISSADQTSPDVGIDQSGDIYAVWSDTRNGQADIYAQRLDSTGVQQWSNDFPISPDDLPDISQGYPIIATDADGNSYVAWREFSTSTGLAIGIYAQRINAIPQRLCPEDKQMDTTIYVSSPAIALSGDGNAFVTWSWLSNPPYGNSNIYVTKLDPDCNLLWGDRVQVTFSSAYEHSPTIAVDTGGNIHLAWEDTRTGSRVEDIYMQKLNANGTRLWPQDRRANSDVGTVTNAPAIAVDGPGNSRVVWWDGRNDLDSLSIYAQQLTTDGVPLWPPNSAVNNTETNVSLWSFPWPESITSMALNSSGIAAVVWEGDDEYVYAQMLSSNGTPLWLNDIPVSSSSSYRSPQATAAIDPDGYVYIVWRDYRRDSTYADIFIQKLDPTDGSKLWGDGKMVHRDEVISNTQQYPAIAFDDQHNSLFVVWSDYRDPGGKIYAQKLDRNGNRLWSEDMPVSGATGNQWEPTVTVAGGYVYIAWRYGGIYAQKLDNDGYPQWGNGVQIGTGERPIIAARANNGNSYVYITWRTFNRDSDRWDILAQRLDPNDGHEHWDTNDIRVNSDDGSTYHGDPSIGVDANGNAYIVWGDRRRGSSDIYAQKLLPSNGDKAWGGDVQVNPEQLYLAEAEARSLEMDVTSGNILWATLTVSQTLPAGSTVTYYLSNKGGQPWEKVTPGNSHIFDTPGNNLRWLVSLEARPGQIETPVIDWLQIKYSTDPDPPNSVRVEDENGLPVPGARVYRNGQFAGITDNEGVFIFNQLQARDTLAALQHLYEQPTDRAAHDDGSGNFAYRVYRTSIPVIGSGEVLSYTVPDSDQRHTLTISPSNTLVLFNLVVSVEWDATDDYLAMLEDAFRQASKYLYDVTDGQMALGQVTIYDRAQYWADADFQFSTKNIVRPYAFVGGITSSDEAHTIRVGRFWDGGSGNNGHWNEPPGYRTLIHEFGHYALYLYDEYFFRLLDANGFSREIDAVCTREEVGPPPPGVSPDPNPEEPGNASMMFYQYKASELTDKTYNWDQNCTSTEQYRLNNSQSDWETVLSHYGGPDWRLNTPSSRGSVMAGPDEFPTQLLPFPEVITNNLGVAGGPSLQVTVLGPQGQPVPNALVALYKTLDHMAIDQGLTNAQGRIAVYGAVPDDTIEAATFDGALAGNVLVNSRTSYTLTLYPTSSGNSTTQAGATSPYLNLIPDTNGDTLTLEVHGTAGGGTLYATVIPGQGGGGSQSPPLAYSPGEGIYRGQASFAGVGLGSGVVRITGVAGSQAVLINSNYNLQQVQAITTNHLYSEDGNFELHIPPGGVSVDGYATVAPTGYVPGPLPTGKQVIGSAYTVRVSPISRTKLDKEGLVRLHYHPEVMGVFTDTAIYYWEAYNRVWLRQGGEPSQVDNAWSVPTRRLGIYALMGVPVVMPNDVYLPIIVKN